MTDSEIVDEITLIILMCPPSDRCHVTEEVSKVLQERESE